MNSIGFQYYGFNHLEITHLIIAVEDKIEYFENLRKINEYQLTDLAQNRELLAKLKEIEQKMNP